MWPLKTNYKHMNLTYFCIGVLKIVSPIISHQGKNTDLFFIGEFFINNLKSGSEIRKKYGNC